MITAKARCTCGPYQPFRATEIERRDLGPYDILIDIAYAGICHTDLHYACDDKKRTVFPLVPGHEIAGIVSAVGVLAGNVSFRLVIDVSTMRDTKAAPPIAELKARLA